MSIQKIIQESINNKPLEMKEAFAEELRNRIAEALAAKMEEVEQIDEISKATLGSYIKKAGGTSLNSAGAHMANYGAYGNQKSFKKGINRAKGVMRAADRLTKEEVELGESSGVHDIKSLQKHFEGPTAYDAAAHSPAMMMRRKGLDGKKYDLIKVGNGKYRSELSEEADLEEAVEVRHDRYMRSHGKKARDAGHPSTWMFTHKDMGDVDYNDEKQVHTARGKFADAKKSAQKWAKEHGHRSVYVMEEVEIDESFGAAIKKAEASRQRALKKAASMVKRGFSHEEAAKNHDVKVADLKKHMGESVNLEEGISPQDYSTHGVKSQFGGYRAHIKHKTKGHTMYTGSHGYDTPKKAKGEAEAYLKGYAEYGDMTANKNAQAYARQHAISGPYARKQANEEVEALDELKKSTLGSYIKKAAERLPKHQGDASAAAQVNSIDHYKKSAKMRDNRKLGIQRAADRLTKE